MIRGAIFDIDGTLLDSMQIWATLGLRYLRTEGIIPEEGLPASLFSMTIEEAAEYFKETFGIDKSVKDIAEGMVSILRSFYENDVELKPGVRELLMRYKEAKIPMILATSGDRTLAEPALRRHGILDLFKGMLITDELGTSKREPRIYLEAAGILGTEPSETIVFEDMRHGLTSAKEAGFVTVAVYDEVSKKEWEWMQEAADYSVRDFREDISQLI